MIESDWRLVVEVVVVVMVRTKDCGLVGGGVDDLVVSWVAGRVGWVGRAGWSDGALSALQISSFWRAASEMLAK